MNKILAFSVVSIIAVFALAFVLWGTVGDGFPLKKDADNLDVTPLLIKDVNTANVGKEVVANAKANSVVTNTC